MDNQPKPEPPIAAPPEEKPAAPTPAPTPLPAAPVQPSPEQLPPPPVELTENTVAEPPAANDEPGGTVTAPQSAAADKSAKPKKPVSVVILFVICFVLLSAIAIAAYSQSH